MSAQSKRNRRVSDEAKAPGGGSTVPDTDALAVRDVVSAIHMHARATFSDPIAPGLYLVATPIGNLSDITLRALKILGGVDVIYCEDTRHSRTLLEHFAIKTPLKPYHEHNASRQRPGILRALAGGSRIALISDAGTPLISDPGFKIVRDAAEAGHHVVSVPGASAGMAAVTASGLPTDTILFAGFLPPKEAGRRKRLATLKDTAATLVFFEAPHRLHETLVGIKTELGDRPACVARELTKVHEEMRRGRLGVLCERIRPEDVKGECVIVVGPPEAKTYTDNEILDLVRDRLETESLKDAARHLAEELQVPKGRVYDLGLTLKRQSKT